MRPGYAGTYTNLQMVYFEYPPKSPLKSSHPKKYLPKFPNQKKPGIENFKLQKTFDHPCHLKSGVSKPPPPRPPLHLLGRICQSHGAARERPGLRVFYFE